MAILMVLEMILDYPVVLPLVLAVVTAHYTAKGHSGVRPRYAESLLPREAV
jgi:H+/Cl- antiporter ClcA